MMELKRISPTSDLAFKKVLASEENRDILGGLIGDFFEVEAEDIKIDNPYDIAAYREVVKGEEATVLRDTLKDVSASFKTADFVSEIQVKKTRFFDERSLYYPFVRYSQNYSKEGFMEVQPDGKLNRYSSLRPVYALNILGYPHFKDDDDALRIFELYDPKRNKRFSKDLLRIGYFEIEKPNIETVNQRHWRDYFTTGEVGSDAPEYIRKASRIIEFYNLTEEERNMAIALEKARAIIDAEINSSFFDGKDIGLNEGLVKGKSEEKLTIAKAMLLKGLSPEVVSECTALPLEIVKTL